MPRVRRSLLIHIIWEILESFKGKCRQIFPDFPCAAEQCEKAAWKLWESMAVHPSLVTLCFATQKGAATAAAVHIPFVAS